MPLTPGTAGSMSYRANDHPVSCTVLGTVYDLRSEKDRNARFHKIFNECEGRALLKLEYHSDPFWASSCLSFDYLSRHSDIRRRLLRNVYDYHWLLEMTMSFTCHRLILRSIFKSVHINLWMFLLTAQITFLPRALSGDTSTWKWIVSTILYSMPYWNAEQLLFARELGLFSMIANKSDDKTRDPRKIILEGNIQIFGFFLSLKFKIKNFLSDQVMATNRCIQDCQSIGSELCKTLRMKENVCGWPPCHRIQMQTDIEQGEMYICKGCRLIKYCCRRHQKKHWKFIHSQQCRQY